MAAKMGRPTDNPKNTMVRVRVDDETLKILDECVDNLNLNRSEVIRIGIKKAYAEIKK